MQTPEPERGPEWIAELTRHGLDDCHGWAFEPCDQVGKWLMIEHWPNGSWAATSLCQHHALEAFKGTDQEFRPPRSRTWWNLADFRRWGEWPQEPA